MNMIVEEFTSINPATINLNATMEFGLKLMSEKGIRHLLVMENDQIVGIVSERDILANYGKGWSNPLRIKQIMKTDVLYVNVKDNIGDVAYKLSVKKVGSAVVLDTNGSVYGIFTTTDALNALVEMHMSQTALTNNQHDQRT